MPARIILPKDKKLREVADGDIMIVKNGTRPAPFKARVKALDVGTPYRTALQARGKDGKLHVVTPEMIAGWMAVMAKRQEESLAKKPSMFGARRPNRMVKDVAKLTREQIYGLKQFAEMDDEQWEKHKARKRRSASKEEVARHAETPEQRAKRLARIKASTVRLKWAKTFASKNNHHVADALSQVIPAIALGARTKYNLGRDPALMTDKYVRTRLIGETYDARNDWAAFRFLGPKKKRKDIKKQIEAVRAVLVQAL
jgi:hypothetical protein